MLREGPIPRLAHGLIEYVVGVFLVAAPFLLGYDDVDMALGISIATGVIILVLAAITEGPTGLVHQLPVSAHVTFDVLLAIFLIAAPFILGFADESAAARNLFIALGVVHLLVSIGTRYRDAAPEGAGSTSGSATSKRSTPPPAPPPSSSPAAPPPSRGTTARPPTSGSSGSSSPSSSPSSASSSAESPSTRRPGGDPPTSAPPT